MTQPINALSLAPDACEWLANSRRPRVLHVFDHACNLINERREVLSIVAPQIGNGPFNLVMEEDVCFRKYLSPQSPISNSPNYLNFGNIIINIANASLWSPRPDWEGLHARKDDILNQIMSLRDCFGRENATLATTLPITNCKFSNSLSSSLANADLAAALTSARRLAGLGIGLTPAGDDFIMGAIYAARIIHPPEIASALAEEIANIAAPLTTSLSAAWLRSAGKGETGVLWHEMFNSLILPSATLEPFDFAQKKSPISKILSVGHTSGADALAGFFGVCLAFKQNIIDGCPS